MSNVYMGENLEEFIFDENATFEVEETTPVVEEGATEPAEGEEEVEVTDEEVNMFGVIECVDEPEVACYRIALENEQNYNTIMNAFMTKEFSVLESTGQEMVYEAVDVKKFFSNVAAAVAKFWAKVQGMFKQVIQNIAAYTATNKSFIEKYKDADIKTPETDKKFKGFKFGNLDVNYGEIYDAAKAKIDVSLIASTDDDKIENLVSTFNESMGKVKNRMRGIACAKQEVAADDFKKALKVRFYGSEEKEEIATLPAFKSLLDDLAKAGEARKAAKDAHASALKSVKDIQKDIKTAERNLAKAEGRRNAGMKLGKCLTDAVNATITIMSQTLSAQMGAIITSARQSRAMAAYYVAHQPKATAESTVVEADDMGIVLI